MKTCFPQKQVKEHLTSLPVLRGFSARAVISLIFCRFGVSDRLHLSRAEGISAVFPDSRAYLLVSLQRDAGAGPSPAPQHALHTPHPLLQAACPAGAGGHRASAGPNHSPRAIEHRHNVRIFTLPSLISYFMITCDHKNIDCVSQHLNFTV